MEAGLTPDSAACSMGVPGIEPRGTGRLQEEGPSDGLIEHVLDSLFSRPRETAGWMRRRPCWGQPQGPKQNGFAGRGQRRRCNLRRLSPNVQSLASWQRIVFVYYEPRSPTKKKVSPSPILQGGGGNLQLSFVVDVTCLRATAC